MTAEMRQALATRSPALVGAPSDIGGAFVSRSRKGVFALNMGSPGADDEGAVSSVVVRPAGELMLVVWWRLPDPILKAYKPHALTPHRTDYESRQ